MIASLSPAGLHSSPNRSSTGRALNWVTRGQPLHPGLVALPGSGAVLEPPGAAPWGAASSSLTGGTGGHVVERVGSGVTASFIHLGCELGGETAQNFAKWLPCSGVFHGSNHEGNRAHEVVKACQRIGNVCRA